MVRILKSFDEINTDKNGYLAKLQTTLTADNIQTEIDYFSMIKSDLQNLLPSTSVTNQRKNAIEHNANSGTLQEQINTMVNQSGLNQESQKTINDMMKSDLKLMTKDVYLQEGGYKTMSYFE